MDRVNEGDITVMEFLGQVLKETAKEAVVSEKDQLPKFFNELPQTESVDNPDKPVDKNSGQAREIYLITRNESLEGDVHPITGVPFERRTIEYQDQKIDGVFPVFETTFDAQISEDLYHETDYTQFKECNAQLHEAIQNDPDLRAKFTEEQVEQIKEGIMDGTAPDGYTWHHDAEPGKIQLVDADIHAKTGHTGGRTVWGGGNENR